MKVRWSEPRSKKVPPQAQKQPIHIQTRTSQSYSADKEDIASIFVQSILKFVPDNWGVLETLDGVL